MIEDAQALEHASADQSESSTTTSIDFDDYDRARFMALDTRPVSTQAISLVNDVAHQIELWEQHSATRRNRRGPALSGPFARAVARVIGDLVFAAFKSPERWSYRTMSRATFSREEVTYRHFMAVFTALKGLGLIEVVRGFYDREGFLSRATRIRASTPLLAMFGQHGIAPTSGPQHFQRTLPSRPLVLKARSTRRGALKVSGRRMNFGHTDQTRALEAEVREINRFIANHELDVGTHRGYRRIFNCGDDPDFHWNKGGRLYSLGEDSYQRLKKDQRLQMRINGEPVSEIDVRASFLTILYALNGARLNPTWDPYDVEGLPRDVVKAWITITLGHDKFPIRWPSETIKDFRKGGLEVSAEHPVRRVREAVLAAHPILANWSSQSTTCFDLMFLESEAIVGTMLRLMREHGVVSLSVHDSLIAPRSQLDLARETLCTEYERAVGVKPNLKVN